MNFSFVYVLDMIGTESMIYIVHKLYLSPTRNYVHATVSLQFSDLSKTVPEGGRGKMPDGDVPRFKNVNLSYKPSSFCYTLSPITDVKDRGGTLGSIRYINDR